MIIARTTPVLTTVTNPNVLAGSAFEYPQVPVQVSLGINASATGSFVTIYAGSRLIAEEFAPYVGAEYPIIPDQMYVNFVAVPGERLVVAARNPTGGTITFKTMVDMQQVA
ncbi:MAG: hypothetical protein [Circular genetic element sp.]|nr:MAG: hypothetical protein [Circular genetic element sp.]